MSGRLRSFLTISTICVLFVAACSFERGATKDECPSDEQTASRQAAEVVSGPTHVPGWCALIAGKPTSEALAVFPDVIAGDPDRAGVDDYLGRLYCLEAAGDYAGVIAWQEKFVLKHPGHPLAEYALEQLAGLAARREFEQPVFEVMRKALELETLNPFAQHLANAYMRNYYTYRADRDRAFEHAGRLGFVTDWLLLGPFESRAKVAFGTNIGPELETQPAEGFKGANRNVEWFRNQIAYEDGYVDFKNYFTPTDNVCGFAAARIEVEKDRNLVLWFGCGSALKVYVDGDLAAVHEEYNEYGENKLSVPVALSAGAHEILVKAVVVRGPWGFTLRVTDPDGSVAAGVAISSEGWQPKKITGAQAGRPDFEYARGVLAYLGGLSDEGSVAARILKNYIFNRRRMGDVAKNPDIDDLKKLAELHPECPPVLTYLAAIETDYNDALHALKKAVGIDPGNHAARIELAMKYFSGGFLRPAADVLESGDFGPLGARRDMLKFRILTQTGHETQAGKLLAEINRKYPDYSVAADEYLRYTVKNPDEYMRLFIDRFGERIEEYVQTRIAQYRFERGEPEKALAIYARLLDYFPSRIRIYGRIYDVHYSRSDYARAAEVAAKLLGFAPRHPDFLKLLARAQNQAGDSQAALQAYKETIKSLPEAADVREYVEYVEPKVDAFWKKYDVDLAAALDFEDRPEEWKEYNIVTILDHGVVRINPNGTTAEMYFMVQKALTDEGARYLSQAQRIGYMPGSSRVEIIEAKTIQPDGSEEVVSDIGDRRSGPGSAGAIYGESGAMKVFSFPNVRKGSIVVKKWTTEDLKKPLYGAWVRQNFWLTGDEPKLKTSWVVISPQKMKMKYDVWPEDIARFEEVSTADAHEKVMKIDIGYQEALYAEQEDRMLPFVERYPVASAYTFENWDEVGVWAWNLMKDKITLDADLKNEVHKLIDGAETETDKLRKIVDFITEKIRYVSISYGEHGYIPHSANETWRAKYGDCKDTATLYVAMLAEAGIEAHLVLVRVGEGNWRHASPGPNIFNHAIAYVPNVDGKSYYIDGTSDYNNLDELLYSDQGADALIVNRDGGKFHRIPEISAAENPAVVKLRANLKKDGKAEGELQLEVKGAWAMFFRQIIEKPEQMKQIAGMILKSFLPGANLTKCDFPEEKGNRYTPWIRIGFTHDKFAEVSASRMTLSVAPRNFWLFNLNQLSRVATRDERKTVLYLKDDIGPFLKRIVFETEIELADGLDAEKLPEDVEIATPVLKFRRRTKSEGRRIVSIDEREVTGYRIAPAEYGDFKAKVGKIDAHSEELLRLKIE